MPVEDDAGEKVTRSAPFFLPDGKHFLYAITGQRRQRSIRVGSLDDPKTTLVLDDAESDVAYVDGHLLVQRGADLVAQPFDLATLSLTGEPRPVATGTHSGVVGPNARFTVSRTGVLVHAMPKLGRVGRLEWFDRTGRSLGVVAQSDETEKLNPSLSPDQRTLAVNQMNPATGNWDIWLVDLPTGRTTRLTTNAGADSDVVWSPDGQHLAYRSNRADHIGIYRMSLADRREDRLVACEIGCGRTMIPYDWTPDGRFILYQSQAGSMTIVSTRGDDEANTVSLPGARAALSPDGQWVAFVSQESGSQHVYVQPFPGPGPRTMVSTIAGGFPQWRGDGKELFFSGRTEGVPFFTVLSVDVTVNGAVIRTSAPRAVVPNVELMSLVDSRPHFAISRDGQRVLMRQLDGPPQPALRVIVNWQAALR